MALAPQKFREIVFLFLYSWEFTQEKEMISLLMRELKVTERHVLNAEKKALEVVQKIENLDTMIREASTEYQLDRISSVEKTVLRLSLFEILFDSGVPPLVSISEGIRLTRKFATKEGASFVNAVLDRLYHQQVAALKSESIPDGLTT